MDTETGSARSPLFHNRMSHPRMPSIRNGNLFDVDHAFPVCIYFFSVLYIVFTYKYTIIISFLDQNMEALTGPFLFAGNKCAFDNTLHRRS